VWCSRSIQLLQAECLNLTLCMNNKTERMAYRVQAVARINAGGAAERVAGQEAEKHARRRRALSVLSP
jgi:hypothetical protein